MYALGFSFFASGCSGTESSSPSRVICVNKQIRKDEKTKRKRKIDSVPHSHVAVNAYMRTRVTVTVTSLAAQWGSGIGRQIGRSVKFEASSLFFVG